MRYVCKVCGYIYDEAKEKEPFETLPDEWKCPLCGAAKSEFEPEGAEAAGAAGAAGSGEGSGPDYVLEPADPGDLTAGQLSVIFSNLARGGEKQFKAEESAWFGKLAEYYASVTPPVEGADTEGLAAQLKKDIESYSGVRAAADEASDRGAARVCVWGEKVTRMLSSLVGRYLSEGEEMLKDTNIWVCTVCGFVYVGDEAPELCPVCKVPAWKFEKIEGRG